MNLLEFDELPPQMVAQPTFSTGTIEFYVRSVFLESLSYYMLVDGWQLTIGIVVEHQYVLLGIDEHIGIDLEGGCSVFDFEFELAIFQWGVYDSYPSFIETNEIG
jgi:hypothetical protein